MLFYRGVQVVCFCGHDEVISVESLDFMRPPRNFNLSPLSNHHRMMALLFGNLSHFVREIKSLFEIFEHEVACQSLDVVVLFHFPPRNLRVKLLDLFIGKSEFSTPARNAF